MSKRAGLRAQALLEVQRQEQTLFAPFTLKADADTCPLCRAGVPITTF